MAFSFGSAFDLLSPRKAKTWSHSSLTGRQDTLLGGSGSDPAILVVVAGELAGTLLVLQVPNLSSWLATSPAFIEDLIEECLMPACLCYLTTLEMEEERNQTE